jgi:glucosamine--fructose-6-phosphate aminotransferase (isomerizing)
MVNELPSKSQLILKEIFNSPKMLKNTLTRENEKIEKIAKEIIKENFKMIYLVGSGASFHVCIAGHYSFGKLTNLNTSFMPATEFSSLIPSPLPAKSLVITFSSDGENRDILNTVKIAKKRGALVISIFGKPNIQLTKFSDYTILTHTGKEKNISELKTYISQLGLINLLAVKIAKEIKVYPAKKIETIEKTLHDTPSILTKILEKYKDPIAAYAKKYRKYRFFYLLGHGPNYASALEGAFNLRKLAQIFADGFAAREFLHGPMQLVNKESPLVIFIPRGPDQEELLNLAKRFIGLEVPILIISQGKLDVDPKLIDEIEISCDFDEILSPLFFIFPFYLFTYYISLEKIYQTYTQENMPV